MRDRIHDVKFDFVCYNIHVLILDVFINSNNTHESGTYKYESKIYNFSFLQKKYQKAKKLLKGFHKILIIEHHSYLMIYCKFYF